MRVDPHVSRAKFKKEMERLLNQELLLQEMGVWAQRAVFPVIDLVFLSRNPPRLVLPLQDGVAVPVGGPIVGLATLPFGVRLALDDYDILPPKVTFHDPWTWALLQHPHIPFGLVSPQGGPGTELIVHGHPNGGHSFLCLRGTRDYHSHPQHTEDEWYDVRPDFSVFALVEEIWRFFVLHSHPLALAPLKVMDSASRAPEPKER